MTAAMRSPSVREQMRVNVRAPPGRNDLKGCHLLEEVTNACEERLPQKSCTRPFHEASGDQGWERKVAEHGTTTPVSTAGRASGHTGRMGGANAAMIAGGMDGHKRKNVIREALDAWYNRK